MASDVDICNLALGHLGDDANVASISPSDGSPQGDHCQRFYPIARDVLLQMHPWSFALTRFNLTLLTDVPLFGWGFAYSIPVTKLVRYLSVNDPTAIDDNNPQPFEVEANPRDGTPIVYTNMGSGASPTTQGFTITGSTNPSGAAMRAILQVTDTSKFSPLFTDTFGWFLASYLAGPILKGEVGMQAAKACYDTFRQVYAMAAQADSMQRQINMQHTPPWMAYRPAPAWGNPWANPGSFVPWSR